MKRVWIGLLLCIAAVLSYYALFSRFAITRDVPWVPFVIFAIAIYLIVTGWRSAPRKIGVTIGAVLSLIVIGAFTFLVTIFSRSLPQATHAPEVGQKVPAFTLPDTNNRPVALDALLNGSKGVLIIFYRGYW